MITFSDSSSLVLKELLSNIFFSETAPQISTKLHRNDPGMALFRNSSKNLIPIKTLVAMVTKLKNIEGLSNSPCLKPEGLGL